LAIPGDTAISASAKEGIGIEEILEAIVERIPAPKPTGQGSLQALGFDSFFDTYKGVVTHVRVFNGELKAGQQVKLLHSGKTVEVKEVGSFNPKPYVREKLEVGETGYFTANIKSPKEVKMGDTITDSRNPSPVLPGFKEIHPMVFSGIYPINTSDYEHLKANMGKLQLNDSAFVYQAETSVALGFGFRCGFLGLLHLEIVQERLEREFAIDLITTAPSVRYRVTLGNGEVLEVDNPTKWPNPSEIRQVEEPMIEATVITREDSLGEILKLLEEKRGDQKKFEHLGGARVMLVYEMPLNEIVLDFYDRLKSASRGYASLDYHLSGYRASSLVKMDVLVAGDPIDALSIIVHKEFAYERGRALIERLRRLIPRQQFEVALQAAIGSKIIARESIAALRKNVLAKCYGGDITRKRKLLEKQKEGKRRMKRVGKVDIPQEAFLAVLKVTQSGQES
ncbi:MAG: translation elongation factor 4, partial [Bryobacteraceae bacterium]